MQLSRRTSWVLNVHEEAEHMKLLSATDLSPRSEFSMERAGWLAEDLGADLSMLHVVPPIESERALEQSLQMAISYMRSRGRPPMWRWGVTPNVIVRTGSPARIISETARRLAPRLLVVGPRRRRGTFDAFEGSIADRAIQARTSPVLIVRQNPRGRYRNVLLALDTTSASIGALQVAEELVMTADASAAVVHAHEAPYRYVLQYAGVDQRAESSYVNAWKHEATTAIRDLLKFCSTDFSRYEILIEECKPAPAILRSVESTGPDLLVIGTRASGRMRRAFAGSVASQVIHKVKCDVLVVPDTSDANATRPTDALRRRSRVSENRARLMAR
jgi:universal stress protein E